MFDFIFEILFDFWSLGLLGKDSDKLIGSTAFIGNRGVHKKDLGNITYSGKILPAYLSQDATCDYLAEGTEVTIVGHLRSALIVAPKG